MTHTETGPIRKAGTMTRTETGPIRNAGTMTHTETDPIRDAGTTMITTETDLIRYARTVAQIDFRPSLALTAATDAIVST